MSAALLLRSYADELVDIPGALNERAHLFPHQKRGIAELVARLRRFNVALLADSVGLGKTRLACAIVRVLHDMGHIAKAAIVTPRKLERNWRKELAVVALREGDEVVLINKDILKRNTPQEAARALRGFGLVIIEEAHQDLRNPGNRFHRNVRDGAGLAQGLLVTATPWNNRRGDIFAMLSPFVRPTVPQSAGGIFDCFTR
jgi:N12 class adenine-specific DNA methylase